MSAWWASCISAPTKAPRRNGRVQRPRRYTPIIPGHGRSSSVFYEPATGHGLPHDPFKAIVAPRPVGWISTLSADGRPNLAPYSFFNAVDDTPPMVAFSSSGAKHSVENAEATGEFVCNLATRALAEA